MTTTSVPPLTSALVQMAEPRALRRRHYAWTALLVLLVVAPLYGANTQHVCARWGQHASRMSLAQCQHPRHEVQTDDVGLTSGQ